MGEHILTFDECYKQCILNKSIDLKFTLPLIEHYYNNNSDCSKYDIAADLLKRHDFEVVGITEDISLTIRNKLIAKNLCLLFAQLTCQKDRFLEDNKGLYSLFCCGYLRDLTIIYLEKCLEFAKKDNDIEFQILCLQKMSEFYLYHNFESSAKECSKQATTLMNERKKLVYNGYYTINYFNSFRKTRELLNVFDKLSLINSYFYGWGIDANPEAAEKLCKEYFDTCPDNEKFIFCFTLAQIYDYNGKTYCARLEYEEAFNQYGKDSKLFINDCFGWTHRNQAVGIIKTKYPYLIHNSQQFTR